MPGGLIMKDSLKELKLEKNKTIPYFSDGEFSMHELLEHLLTQTGNARVSISSFSVTEIAVRTFLRLTESGLIKSLHCLFDLNVKRHHLDMLYFTSNVVSSIGLTKNHSKMILISNDHWRIVVVSSANFNVNDKKEVGIISTERNIYNQCLQKFKIWFHSSIKIDRDDFK